MESDKIIKLIQSDDHKDRLHGEYLELAGRSERLHNLIGKYETHTLDFTPDCPIALLKMQYEFMIQYLHILKLRVELEHIDLEDSDDDT